MNSLRTKAQLQIQLSGSLDFSGMSSVLEHLEFLLVTKDHRLTVEQKKWLTRHSIHTQLMMV